MSALRWLLVPLLVIPLAWLLFQGFGRDPRQVASPLIDQPAPEWTLATLDGETLGSDDLAGTPYVVNFWASWCIPACVDELPVLDGAHEDGVVMGGVLWQNAPEDAQAFLDRYGDAGYQHVIDDRGSLAVDFGVTGPPGVGKSTLVSRLIRTYRERGRTVGVIAVWVPTATCDVAGGTQTVINGHLPP